MHGVTEKIRRKTAQALYRAGLYASRKQRNPIEAENPIAEIAALDPDQRPLRFYPYHFIRPWEIQTEFTFDDRRVPLRHRADNRDYINPLYPAYWGLINWNQYELTGNDDFLRVALAMGKELLNLGDHSDSGTALYYSIDHPVVHLKKPWVSGITQALTASLFIRLGISDRSYLRDGENCIRLMLMPIESGGTLRKTPEDGMWIEEYPGQIPTHVLNGNLFGIIAALEGGTKFHQYIDPLFASLISSYPEYRKGRYLLYDRLRKKFCSPHYMGMHVLLFYHIFLLTGINDLLQCACALAKDTDWLAYGRSIHCLLPHNITAWVSEHILQPSNL